MCARDDADNNRRNLGKGKAKVSGLLTVGEVAKELRLAPISVHRRIRDGQLRAVKLGAAHNSPVRVRESELERYVEKSGTR
jgi:excisionase family DNA binding protein